ncbi:NAD(P)H-dependent oxidoreductase [Brevibacillus laterosporus]|uniref:NAD(P)H-dependent oxidoreductase n=1 Tax=Brevibacillus laterosporus TaxID=1465 RepID=UPI002E1FD19D|nr:NAD(P)H-dependent oxidoreductase [Brevibacillus laterosporus]
MKKILIIQGNPVKESYGEALAEAYQKGAVSTGAEVKSLRLANLDFNPNLAGGYKNKPQLEDDLILAQQLISWADHLVFVYPIWWGAPPALLKGFLDRVFMPGYAFSYKKGSSLPQQLLKGRSARLIVTMDSPYWYYSLVQGKPGHRMMKKSTLQFCGISPVKITTLSQVGKADDEKRKRWLRTVNQLGKQLR